MENRLPKQYKIGLKLSWVEAISLSNDLNMLVPNSREAKDLGLIDCWTSSTDQTETTKALIIGEAKPIDKSERRPVVLIERIETITSECPSKCVDWTVTNMNSGEESRLYTNKQVCELLDEFRDKYTSKLPTDDYTIGINREAFEQFKVSKGLIKEDKTIADVEEVFDRIEQITEDYIKTLKQSFTKSNKGSDQRS